MGFEQVDLRVVVSHTHLYGKSNAQSFNVAVVQVGVDIFGCGSRVDIEGKGGRVSLT